MEFQKVLETRRSVRKYDPNVSVTREQMEELIRAAQEAPSWKNSQTGRYYCVLSEEIVNKIRENCLPGARNAEKSEHAALIVTTFVHNRAGFQTDGTPDHEILLILKHLRNIQTQRGFHGSDCTSDRLSVASVVLAAHPTDWRVARFTTGVNYGGTT